MAKSYGTNRTALNPLLRWLWDLLSMFSSEEIITPTDFHSQADEVRKVLVSDTSGIVNSILDFAIECALVDYTFETNKESLTKKLEEWKNSVNSSLRGRVPTGLDALAYQYFRERWKGSSLLLLRTTWEEVDDFILPTKMWFLDGINVLVEDENENVRVIGEEKYYVRLTKDEKKLLPAGKDEMIFVQKPYSSWNPLYPIPFLIQRGLWKNLKLLKLVNRKGEKIIAKALEYLLLIKKGTEQLTLSGKPEFTYSEQDLTDIKNNFSEFVQRTKKESGIPTHVTNFDTEFEHFIPDYTKAFSETLFAPIEKRLLAGLGLIEIVEGVASTRREGILNPKPFITEVYNGIKDFKSLLNDIIQTIIEKNASSHRKFATSDIHIYTSPIMPFIDDKIRAQMRSMYDRGVISKQTYAEVCGADVNFPIEIQRRQNETDKDLDIKMYAPIIDNREGVGIDYPDDTSKPPKLTPILPKSVRKPTFPPSASPTKKETVPVSKKGPEKKNFKADLLDEDSIDMESLDDYDLVEESYSPEVTKNYVRLRQKSPDAFEQDSFRIIVLSESKGIKAVVGRLKGQTSTTIQSYLFQKDKWTVKEAQNWVSKHKGFIEEIEEQNEDIINDDMEISVVVKRKDGWHVISEKTGKSLGGPYKTKQEAVKRLRQIEWFKHHGTEEIEIDITEEDHKEE